MVGGLNRILAFSKTNTKSPNIYECKRILKDFINYDKKLIDVDAIQKIVALHCPHGALNIHLTGITQPPQTYVF